MLKLAFCFGVAIDKSRRMQRSRDGKDESCWIKEVDGWGNEKKCKLDRGKRSGVIRQCPPRMVGCDGMELITTLRPETSEARAVIRISAGSSRHQAGV